MRFIFCMSAAALLLMSVAPSQADDGAPTTSCPPAPTCTPAPTPAPSPAPATTPTPAPVAPRGQWVVAQRVYKPTCCNASAAQTLTGLGFKVKIWNGQIKAEDACKVGYVLNATFDPTQSPMTVDFQLPAAAGGGCNPILQGIYKEANGILTIAVGTGNTRPTTFANADNTVPDGQIMLVLVKGPRVRPQP